MTKLGVGLQGGNIGSQLAGFESLIGRPVDVTRHYQNWAEPIVDAEVQASIAAGKTPLIAWHPFYPRSSSTPAIRWTDIAAGKYDADIDRVIGELKTVGSSPVLFEFHHEPEDDVDSIAAQGACGTGPTEFVAAWRHVKGRMRKALPRSIQLGICLMGATYRGRKGGPDAWCPSTSNPDFIATDGYSRDASSGQNPRTFLATFGEAYNFAKARNEPFVIQECGTAELETDPNFKADWFKDMGLWVNQWTPAVAMYSNYFATNFNGQDYRIDTSPQALQSFNDNVVGTLPA